MEVLKAAGYPNSKLGNKRSLEVQKAAGYQVLERARGGIRTRIDARYGFKLATDEQPHRVERRCSGCQGKVSDDVDPRYTVLSQCGESHKRMHLKPADSEMKFVLTQTIYDRTKQQKARQKQLDSSKGRVLDSR